jgi:hypothetical protein
MGMTSPPAPPEFAAALARHLKENAFLTYDVILVIDKTDEEFWKKNDARFAFYQEHGVADRVKLWIVKSSRPLGFDVIVIDSKHFHTTFSPIDPAENKREMALFLDNSPELAAHLSKWYVNLPGKIAYAEARRDWEKQKRAKGAL